MALIDKETIRKEIVRRMFEDYNGPDAEQNETAQGVCAGLLFFLDSLPEQPVIDHHEIEVEFRGEKVTISREFYRDGERNYSTSEQDDNAIWSALRAWCEKKGITPFELYPKQPEQPVYGLEEEMDRYYDSPEWEGQSVSWMTFTRIARHFADWGAKHTKQLSDE